MWYPERNTKSRNTTLPKFQRCCHGRKVKLPMIDDPPEVLQKLIFNHIMIEDKNYQANTRTYNAMFLFTSLGMKFEKKLPN